MAPKKRVPPPSSDNEKVDTLIKTKGPCISDDEEEEVSSSSEEEETPKPDTQTKTKTKSGSDDEEGDEEEEEDDEDEQTPAKQPIIQKPKSPSGSSSESESESDSKSGKTQNTPTASAFFVKPILSKPMPDSTKPKKPDALKPVNAKPLAKRAKPKSPSGSSSESESAKIQNFPTACAFFVKPNLSKQMPDSTKPKKPDALKPVNAKPLAKRAAEPEINGVKDSKIKKMKVSNEDVRSEEKRPAVTRLWSDDDEIVVLQGMVNYVLKKGVDPNADMGGFHESIKGDLSVDVSKSQLSEKIRRLKKKYMNNVEKSGNDAVFSKPHDHKSFELSKKIWGGNANANAVEDGGKSTDGEVKKSGRGACNGKVLVKPKEKEIVVREKEEDNDIAGGDEVMDVNGDGEFTTMYPFLNAALEVQLGTEPFLALSEEDRRLIKAKLRDSSNVKEMNDKWKMYKVEEFELYMNKLKLMKDMNGMLLAALKSA